MWSGRYFRLSGPLLNPACRCHQGMTNLSTRMQTVFSARLLLATWLATHAIAVPAQETVDEAPGSPLDASAVTELAVERSAPAAPVADVSRQQTGLQVMDRIELERTEITGDQALPRILYIVPWQQTDPDELPGPSVSTLLEAAPMPVDHEEFARQVEYYDGLYGKKE